MTDLNYPLSAERAWEIVKALKDNFKPFDETDWMAFSGADPKLEPKIAVWEGSEPSFVVITDTSDKFEFYFEDGDGLSDYKVFQMRFVIPFVGGCPLKELR